MDCRVMGRFLSRLQRYVLSDLLDYTESAESRDGYIQFGVPMTWLRPRDRSRRKSRANSATWSRAMRSLEKRGLVIRSNVRSGMRGSGKIRTSAEDPLAGRTDHIS